MTIRPFSADLQADLEAFYADSYARMGWAFRPEDKHADIRAIDREYVARNGGFWLAVEDDLLIGSVALRELSNGIAELKRLQVHHAYQGRGIGLALMRHVLGEARRRGFRAVRLDTTSQSTTALAMFRRFGFAEIDRYNDNPDAEYWLALDLGGS